MNMLYSSKGSYFMKEGNRDKYSTEQLPHLTQIINTVWDMGSGGMLWHLSSVKMLLRGKQVSPRDDSRLASYYESLSGYHSNYLINPYALGWMGDQDYVNFAPQHSAPWLTQMKDLVLKTKSLYDILGSIYTHETLQKDPSIFTEAAIYKLACMVGLTQQICFDAYMGGSSIQPEYIDPRFNPPRGRSPLTDTFVALGPIYEQSHRVIFDNVKRVSQSSRSQYNTFCA
jgi:hypothetical protein